MKIITEEILDQAIAAAKRGYLDDLTYKQSRWCGTACGVLGFARHIAGSKKIAEGPRYGEIVNTPRGQTLQALMWSGSPEILDVMAAVLSDGLLPANFTVNCDLSLRNCASLETLPDGLCINDSLDLYGCTGLKSLPNDLTVGGHLYLSRCTSLKSLPAGLSVGGNIYIFGCLTSVPATAKIGGKIYR